MKTLCQKHLDAHRAEAKGGSFADGHALSLSTPAGDLRLGEPCEECVASRAVTRSATTPRLAVVPQPVAAPAPAKPRGHLLAGARSAAVQAVVAGSPAAAVGVADATRALHARRTPAPAPEAKPRAPARNLMAAAHAAAYRAGDDGDGPRAA